MAKDYEVEIRDWQGVSYQTFYADNHAQAVSLCREWMKLNGRSRNDGPVSYRPRVKKSAYSNFY